MHIPDGYLSPSTCAVLYGASAPFWYIALKRVQRFLHARTVPLLALFSAFSFVVMMFNLPLPGGTTGHAVGMGMASIVLGPWVSILAISTALLIQALFFGDGGITAFGANCFNMAIVGSLTAYGLYRVLSLGSDIRSARRVFAAGIAGYGAINLAAFCAAVEFGIQPALFHDAAGAPLYAPYPLSISVPAMMIGHLTFAGLAELLLTAAVVRFLQQTDPQLLANGAHQKIRLPGKVALRRLWFAAIVSVLLTPLGILAVGNAWGEWSARDFTNATTRLQIAAASHGALPPPYVPSGLRHYFGIWPAPFAAYAPHMIASSEAAYLFSAVIGVVLVLACVYAFARFAMWRGRTRRQTFTRRTLAGVLRFAQTCFAAEHAAHRDGFVQAVDARVKLAGIGALIVAAVAVRNLPMLGVLFGIAVALGLLARMTPRMLVGRVWLPVLAFTGTIALPSLFLVPGSAVLRLPFFGWAISHQGLASASLLLLRAETAATFSVVVVFSTPWPRLLRALRFFRIPRAAVLTMEMAHRYVFLLVRSVEDMLESRESRSVGELEPAEQRRVAASTAGVLLDKSLKLSEDVYCAMQARGFLGEIYLLDENRLSLRSWVELSLLVALACAVAWVGR